MSSKSGEGGFWKNQVYVTSWNYFCSSGYMRVSYTCVFTLQLSICEWLRYHHDKSGFKLKELGNPEGSPSPHPTGPNSFVFVYRTFFPKSARVGRQHPQQVILDPPLTDISCGSRISRWWEGCTEPLGEATSDAGAFRRKRMRK